MKFIFFLTILIFCFKVNLYCQELNYDVQIEYLTIPHNDDRALPNDTLVILFDGNFDNDTVNIFINNQFYKEVVFTTDKRDGIAGEVKTVDFKKVNNISLRINSGKLIYIEPEKKHYNIRLTYIKDQVKIRFYRKFPGFM